jgi:MFS family permease
MKSPRSSIYITSLIASAFFMENLDGTIIATALPQMARSFHVGAVNLNIGMTAYLITLAVFIPISGWVADRFGSRSVFAAAIAAFTLSSLFCGFSHTLTQFTLMRILQGMGGAMMVPVGRLIVLRNTPKDQLTQAIAYMTWPGLSALVLGPPLGGFITTYASWNWIFFLNLPLGIAALVLTFLWIENVRSAEIHPLASSLPWKSSAAKALTGSFLPSSCFAVFAAGHSPSSSPGENRKHRSSTCSR